MSVITTLSTWTMLLLLLLSATAAVSAFLYWHSGRRVDAFIVCCAAIPLVFVLLQLPTQENATSTFLLDTRQPLPPMVDLRARIAEANAVALQGDGLFASQWQDVPARRLTWQRDTRPAGEVLQLDFPTQIAYGRAFQLSVTRAQAKAEWRIQLLAENQQILAEQKGTSQQLTLTWLAPMAARMVLQARVLSHNDEVIDQGPIPLNVVAMQPLQIQGRFSAPSFDLQALNALLTQSDAVLDWQVQLGKGIVRKESPRLAMLNPQVLIQDATYFEQLTSSARRVLMDQVAAGATLLILGANTQQPAMWKKALGLSLRQSEASEFETSQGAKLSSGTWLPSDLTTGPWQVLPEAGVKIHLMAEREWDQGKIVWLATTNWHQAMITEPQKLTSWWQSVLDRSGVKTEQDWQLEVDRLGQGMAMPGQRIELCGRGLEQRQIEVSTESESTSIHLQMQAVADRAEAQCAAFWPTRAGWLRWQTLPSNDSAKASLQAQGSWYVYQSTDWSSWQRHQRQSATEQYRLRLPEGLAEHTQRSIVWPWILLSMVAMLGLWWREQRQ